MATRLDCGRWPGTETVPKERYRRTMRNPGDRVQVRCAPPTRPGRTPAGATLCFARLAAYLTKVLGVSTPGNAAGEPEERQSDT
jgi:hypothetical protein